TLLDQRQNRRHGRSAGPLRFQHSKHCDILRDCPARLQSPPRLSSAGPERDCRLMPRLPEKPDFAAIEAAAPKGASRRMAILTLIGNLVYCWSNNESLFIYILMLLMESDEPSAAVVFGTLNTTRARIDLIERLAKIKIRDKSIEKKLDDIVERFNDTTRIRNEFNHCMYVVDDHGEITHTNHMRVQEV